MSQPREQSHLAQGPTMVPNLPAEESPTRGLPRVKMSMQRLSTREMVNPAAADTAKADEEKELAEDVPHGAQDYRARVEEVQLPADARKAALYDVGKLERTDDQRHESSDIGTWLDKMFDGTDRATFLIDELLDGARPSGVPAPNSADNPYLTTIPPDAHPQYAADLEIERKIRSLIQGEREPNPPAADTEKVETETVDRTAADPENLQAEKVEPAAADTKMVDGGKVDPALTGEIAWPVPLWAADTEMGDGEIGDLPAADIEKADTPQADSQADDTVEIPAVLAGLSGGPHPPQLPEQHAHEPVQVQNPVEKSRFGSLALAATALAALLIGTLLFGASEGVSVTTQSVPAVKAAPTATVSVPASEPSDESTHTVGEESTIRLDDLPDPARPFETVRIQGKYRGGADTFLQVQRWEGGKWLAFPVPTKADQSGRFTALVEFGQPGRYRLRVLDSGAGVTSKTFVLVITA